MKKKWTDWMWSWGLNKKCSHVPRFQKWRKNEGSRFFMFAMVFLASLVCLVLTVKMIACTLRKRKASFGSNKNHKNNEKKKLPRRMSQELKTKDILKRIFVSFFFSVKAKWKIRKGCCRAVLLLPQTAWAWCSSQKRASLNQHRVLKSLFCRWKRNSVCRSGNKGEYLQRKTSKKTFKYIQKVYLDSSSEQLQSNRLWRFSLVTRRCSTYNFSGVFDGVGCGSGCPRGSIGGVFFELFFWQILLVHSKTISFFRTLGLPLSPLFLCEV